MIPLLLKTPSVPPPITISFTPSPLRSQALGEDNEGMESVKACQLLDWPKFRKLIAIKLIVKHLLNMSCAF
jgi:hypothetical protein